MLDKLLNKTEVILNRMLLITTKQTINSHLNSLNIKKTMTYVVSITDVDWMNDVQRENIAHMMASMHLVLRQQDGGEKDAGEYRHVTNTSFEKFVERYKIFLIMSPPLLSLSVTKVCVHNS